MFVLCSKSPPLICEGGEKKGKKEKLYQTVKQLINLSGVIPAAVVEMEGSCRHLGPFRGRVSSCKILDFTCERWDP